MTRRQVVLALLVSLAVITYLDRLCISVLATRMQADLGISVQLWGWVLAAFTISYGALEIPAGALGDRYGHRHVLTRIVIWWSLFTALTGMAGGFGALVAVRFLFGAGEAGAFPNISGSASRWFAGDQRARVQGLVWGGSRVGAAIAPGLIGLIVGYTGDWRHAFWIFGGVGFVWAAIWYAWYRERPTSLEEFERSPSGGAKEPPVATHVPAPAPWRRLFAAPQLWLIMVTYSFYVWGSTFYLSLLHQYLEKGRGFSKAEVESVSWLPFVLGAMANPIGGWMSDALCRRFGLKAGRRAMGSTCLAIAACLLLATASTSGKWSGLALLSVGFAVLDLMLPTAWAVCMDVGGRHAGAVSGAMNSFGHVGGTLCSLAFGYLAYHSGSYNVPLAVVASMVFVAAVLFTRIDPSRPLLPDEEPAPV